MSTEVAKKRQREDVFKANKGVIINNIIPCKETYDAFTQFQILTPTATQDLQNIQSRVDKNLKIFDCVLTSSIPINKFCDVLDRSGHSFLADHLRSEEMENDVILDVTRIAQQFKELEKLIPSKKLREDLYEYLTIKLKEFASRSKWKESTSDKITLLDITNKKFEEQIRLKSIIASQEKDIINLQEQFEDAMNIAQSSGLEMKQLSHYLHEMKNHHTDDINIQMKHNEANEKSLIRLNDRIKKQEETVTIMYKHMDEYFKELALRYRKGPYIEDEQVRHLDYQLTIFDKASYAFEKLFKRIEVLEGIRSNYFELLEDMQHVITDSGIVCKDDFKETLQQYITCSQKELVMLRYEVQRDKRDLEIFVELVAQLELEVKDLKKQLLMANAKFQDMSKHVRNNQVFSLYQRPSATHGQKNINEHIDTNLERQYHSANQIQIPPAALTTEGSVTMLGNIPVVMTSTHTPMKAKDSTNAHQDKPDTLITPSDMDLGAQLEKPNAVLTRQTVLPTELNTKQNPHYPFAKGTPSILVTMAKNPFVTKPIMPQSYSKAASPQTVHQDNNIKEQDELAQPGQQPVIPVLQTKALRAAVPYIDRSLQGLAKGIQPKAYAGISQQTDHQHQLTTQGEYQKVAYIMKSKQPLPKISGKPSLKNVSRQKGGGNYLGRMDLTQNFDSVMKDQVDTELPTSAGHDGNAAADSTIKAYKAEMANDMPGQLEIPTYTGTKPIGSDDSIVQNDTDVSQESSISHISTHTKVVGSDGVTAVDKKELPTSFEEVQEKQKADPTAYTSISDGTTTSYGVTGESSSAQMSTLHKKIESQHATTSMSVDVKMATKTKHSDSSRTAEDSVEVTDAPSQSTGHESSTVKAPKYTKMDGSQSATQIVMVNATKSSTIQKIDSKTEGDTAYVKPTKVQSVGDQTIKENSITKEKRRQSEILGSGVDDDAADGKQFADGKLPERKATEKIIEDTTKDGRVKSYSLREINDSANVQMETKPTTQLSVMQPFQSPVGGTINGTNSERRVSNVSISPQDLETQFRGRRSSEQMEGSKIRRKSLSPQATDKDAPITLEQANAMLGKHICEVTVIENGIRSYYTVNKEFLLPRSLQQLFLDKEACEAKEKIRTAIMLNETQLLQGRNISDGQTRFPQVKLTLNELENVLKTGKVRRTYIKSNSETMLYNTQNLIDTHKNRHKEKCPTLLETNTWKTSSQVELNPLENTTVWRKYGEWAQPKRKKLILDMEVIKPDHSTFRDRLTIANFADVKLLLLKMDEHREHDRNAADIVRRIISTVENENDTRHVSQLLKRCEIFRTIPLTAAEYYKLKQLKSVLNCSLASEDPSASVEFEEKKKPKKLPKWKVSAVSQQYRYDTRNDKLTTTGNRIVQDELSRVRKMPSLANNKNNNHFIPCLPSLSRPEQNSNSKGNRYKSNNSRLSTRKSKYDLTILHNKLPKIHLVKNLTDFITFQRKALGL